MNKKLSLSFLVLLILISMQAGAQTWSKAQQEVIDQVETCFNAWWPATSNNDLNIFLKACPCDDDFAVWAAAYGAPVGIDAIADIFASGVSAASDEPVVTIRPTRVKIAEDLAIIFYYIDLYQVDTEALFMNFNTAKRMSVFHQVNGRWQLAADMMTPVENE